MRTRKIARIKREANHASLPQDHLILLADLLSLHAQDELAFQALCNASQLISAAATAQSSRLALICALRGYTNLAESALLKGAQEPGGAYVACLHALTKAMLAVHRGDAESAGKMVAEYAQDSINSSRKAGCWSKIRGESGRTAADEAQAFARVVCGEIAWQGADGVAAVRHVVASLHALMSMARHRHMISGQNAAPGDPVAGGRANNGSDINNGAFSAGSNNLTEGQDSAAVQGGEDVYALATGVCSKAVDVSHWRVLCDVARGLRRAGDVMAAMGRSKEAEYYYMQVHKTHLFVSCLRIIHSCACCHSFSAFCVETLVV